MIIWRTITILSWLCSLSLNLLYFSLESGYRNSGLTVGKAGKIVLAVRSTHGLEVPLTDHHGKLLVDENYIKFIAEEANIKLSDNETRIRNYENKCNQKLFESKISDCQDASSVKAIKKKGKRAAASDKEND